jgi:hypothetical protein
MNLRTKLVSIASATAVAGAFTVGPTMSAQAAPTTRAASVAPAAAKPAPTSTPVTGTLADGTAFTGALSDLTVKAKQGVMTATGTITGTGLPAGGSTFTAPVQSLATPAGCTILTLDLGPLHLDVLGLVVDLNAIHLNITAQPGPGNLLGNLLCAVAGLLDGNGINGLAALLNRLLGL